MCVCMYIVISPSYTRHHMTSFTLLNQSHLKFDFLRERLASLWKWACPKCDIKTIIFFHLLSHQGKSSEYFCSMSIFFWVWSSTTRLSSSIFLFFSNLIYSLLESSTAILGWKSLGGKKTQQAFFDSSFLCTKETLSSFIVLCIFPSLINFIIIIIYVISAT